MSDYILRKGILENEEEIYRGTVEMCIMHLPANCRHVQTVQLSVDTAKHIYKKEHHLFIVEPIGTGGQTR